jgi:acetolactate synthase-1/2/3 large subunit
MKKTAAWLARYALEQLPIEYTFGIPGVHNTELYDELDKSVKITPMLVTHEGYGAFMADAVSRSSNNIGCCVIVPAAGATHAASGIGEAFLDGIAMLVISGGVRNDSAYKYQLHDMDQHKMLEPITKQCFKVECHKDVIPTIYQAYLTAIQGEPGPVFVEIPVNLQLDLGEVDELLSFEQYCKNKIKKQSKPDRTELINQAIDVIKSAKNVGLFLGWGAVDALHETKQLAEHLHAPVATTLQGLSAFDARHPLHTGMGFGEYSVPAATNAFKNIDCLIAVGTRFAEIGTGSFGINVPEKLIHIDINPQVFNANYPASVAIEGDANQVLADLMIKLKQQLPARQNPTLIKQIKHDKQAYVDEWLAHGSGNRVNPASFFIELRSQLNDDAFVIADDGNHTFLTAELMPCYQPHHFFSPTDFNCMGYAIPAVIGAKLSNPNNQVVGIIGDGAFLMSQTELFTASAHHIGAIFTIFNDGELAQISQAQHTPYNKNTCTTLPNTRFEAIALASGCDYIRIATNDDIEQGIATALQRAAENQPVVLDVNIDYTKKTRFTQGIIKTNLKRMPVMTKTRMISRALWRRVVN